ncbi:hypothetical protein JXB22_02980 [candidate division WOR-3 bacterium]|nr:hypothetical protein [candidate division WOR-3 bacterium]
MDQTEQYIKFEYDEQLNVVFTEDHWDVKATEDVDQFFAEYKKYFTELGRKVYMISNIDHLLVRAAIADYYGKTARSTVGHYLLGFARYGTNDWARMTVRTTSLKASMTPNIYDSREAAIAAIEKMKTDSQPEAEGSKPKE